MVTLRPERQGSSILCKAGGATTPPDLGLTSMLNDIAGHASH